MSFIKKITNNEMVDISLLSIEELDILHYEEEAFVAEQVLKLLPFSKERELLLKTGYDLVFKILNERQRKEKRVIHRNGVTHNNVNILCALIKNKIKANERDVVLFEAGAGSGFAINRVLKKCNSPKLFIKACDICISDNLRRIENQFLNVELKQMGLYQSLKELSDNSVDIFYADNVIEHLIPDESGIIFSEIAKKLKPDGFVLLIIPNKHLGPGDISMKFLPFGEKARGFHFMELSFNEITKIMNKYNVHHIACAFRISKEKGFIIKSKYLVKIKLKLENFYKKIPNKFIRRCMFAFGGYTISIMKIKKVM